MIDLRHGDCLEILKNLESNSVDLVLSDPPYELGFMGKKWDNTGIAFSIDLWKEVYRVLKPGGYCMAFSGTRTYHRMAVAIEDAGFEIKDMIEWVYGSGFPKALDISKALDKKLGKEREVIGVKDLKRGAPIHKQTTENSITGWNKEDYSSIVNITKPSSDIAKQYEGYKTQLKPAHEPICLALKPLSEKTFAENVMKWGTGGLNIDGTRIGHNEPVKLTKRTTKNYIYGKHDISNKDIMASANPEGRFPANFIISEDIAPVLDGQSGYSKSSDAIRRNNQSKTTGKDNGANCYGKYNDYWGTGYSDEGGASRFFYNAKIEEEDYIPFKYTAKASKKERNSNINGNVVLNNNHATVKPISIMEYLAKLGLPPYNGVVLDMFAGSGSTGMAIEKINRETGSKHKTILIERESEYIEIIKKRLNLEEE